MKVLVTGSHGQVGTAIMDHLHDDAEYEFTYFNRSDRSENDRYGEFDVTVGNVTDRRRVMEVAEGHDAMIHLACYPSVEADWEEMRGPNIEGTRNALDAARAAEMDTFVFGSTNHILGMYEKSNAPDIYYPGHGVALDRHSETRPDSYYASSKAFGEQLGRQYTELYDFPKQFLSLRICSLRHREYDHPYGDAERYTERGDFERGSEGYKERVARMKAMWQSRRDFAHQVDCCLQNESVDFGIYSGVSDNDRRWFSIEHARSELGYSPQDNGDEWSSPPEWSGDFGSAPIR